MATTPVNEDTFLASQCLNFCQMLAGKSPSFSFSLKVGTNIFQKIANIAAYLIIDTDATDAVSVNFFGRCKFLQI